MTVTEAGNDVMTGGSVGGAWAVCGRGLGGLWEGPGKSVGGAWLLELLEVGLGIGRALATFLF